MKKSEVKNLVVKGLKIFADSEIANYSAATDSLYLTVGDSTVSVKIDSKISAVYGIITASICGEKIFKVYIKECAGIKFVTNIFCANRYIMRAVLEVVDDEESDAQDIYCDSVTRTIVPTSCGYIDLLI